MQTFFQMLQASNKPQLGMCNTFNCHRSAVVFAALKMVLALKIHRFCIVPLNWHSFLKTVYVFGPHRSNEARKNTFPYQLIFLCFDFEVDSKARFRGLSHTCVKSMQRFSIPIMIPEAFYTSSFSHLFLVSS